MTRNPVVPRAGRRRFPNGHIGLAAVLTVISLLSAVLFSSPLMASNPRSDNSQFCKIPGSGLWSPPGSTTGPVEIEVEFFLIDLVQVNDRSNSFTIDFVMNLLWQDDRLAGLSDSDTGCLTDLDSIWHPAFIFLNAGESAADQMVSLEVSRDGEVIYSRRYTRVFSADLDLRRFPFDKQALRVRLASLLYGPDTVSFQAAPELTSVYEGAGAPGWTLRSLEAGKQVTPVTTATTSHSSLVYDIVVERQSAYYFWRLMFPLLLLTLMAWSVFWLSPDHLGAQVAVATGSIFSLMSFLVTQGQILPSDSYMTIADILIVISVLLIFTAFGESVVTGHLAMSGRNQLAQRIDRGGRLIYATVVILVVVWVIIVALL